MKLKKCSFCESYCIGEICPHCKKDTNDAHYKFLNIKDETSKIKRRKNENRKRII